MSLPNHLKSQCASTLTTATFPNHSSAKSVSRLTLLTSRPSVSPWSLNAMAFFSTHLISHYLPLVLIARSSWVTFSWCAFGSFSTGSFSFTLLTQFFKISITSFLFLLPSQSLLFLSTFCGFQACPLFQFQTYISTASLTWVWSPEIYKHKPDLPTLLCCFFYFLFDPWYSSVIHTRKAENSHMNIRHLWICPVHNRMLCTLITTCLIN